MFSTSPSSYEHSNRVAAARSLAAAAALATVGNGNGSGASPAVVYRLIEQADRKNKVMSADPKRTLFRTLLQRRHFQILRDAAAQVERAHQAELLREQQRLQEQIFNLRFQQTGHAGHFNNNNNNNQTQTPTTQTVKSTVPAGGPIAIARPAHFNAALLRNKDSQGWPSNQWTASAAAVTAAPVPAPVPASVPASVVMEEEYHESSSEDVTFESEESNVSSVSAFEQEWMEVTSSSLPVGTAPMCTVTISTATTTTTTLSTPSTPLSTGSSSSFFGLPCGTAGLSVGTYHQSEVNQEVVVSSSPSSSSSSSKYSRVVAAPTQRSEGRGWGNGSGKRGACSSSFVGGSAKKIREYDEEEEEEVEQEKREVRIGFASSPFQWQSLFDQSQLQQVLCN